MTEDERRRWERDNPKILNQGPKKSWKFMQKYWHKGAFFQEVSDNPHASGSKPDEIFTRDYSAPTGEDKLNKEILPKVRPWPYEWGVWRWFFAMFEQPFEPFKLYNKARQYCLIESSKQTCIQALE